ncbi:unnamed protein product, partial [Laminaria digitata]
PKYCEYGSIRKYKAPKYSEYLHCSKYKSSKYWEHSKYLEYFFPEILYFTPRYWEHLCNAVPLIMRAYAALPWRSTRVCPFTLSRSIPTVTYCIPPSYVTPF